MLQWLLEKGWTFANSPVGVTIVSGVFLSFLSWLFTKVPKVEKLFQTYKGPLMDAVRRAEEIIPDDTPNKGLAKADAAFKYFLTLAPEMAKHNEVTVKTLLNQAHKETKEFDLEYLKAINGTSELPREIKKEDVK